MAGLSRRGIRYLGVTFLLFRLWYPAVEEGRLRWPQTEDLVYCAFAIAIGAGILFLVARCGD